MAMIGVSLYITGLNGQEKGMVTTALGRLVQVHLV